MISQAPRRVLNANVTDAHVPLSLYSALMFPVDLPTAQLCPDPWMRAPLAGNGRERPHARLYPPPPALQGAVVAIACRDTRGFVLTDAQRLTHFPASPLVCLSWDQGVDVGVIESGPNAATWRPFDCAFTLSGSQSGPMASWARNSGRAGMICFEADAARALFGIDLSVIQDTVVPAEPLMGPAWRPFLDAFLATQTDAASLSVLQQHLAEPWRKVRGGSGHSSLREAGRYWVQRLAWQAREWGRTHGPRQVERRVKAFSGRSLREWQSLVKTESLFFSARERYETGQPLDWATLALDEGFSDQAHLSRAVKRTTGFSPSEFAERFGEDESFWMYRLWV